MIKLPVKLQKIYFQDDNSDLGIHYVANTERITMNQAEEILQEKGITFKQVFQVKKETVELELTEEQLQELIVQ